MYAVNYKKFFLYPFFIFIPLDMMNGILIREVGGSFSLVFKAVLSMVLFAFLLRSRYRIFLIFLFLFSLFITFFPVFFSGVFDNKLNIFKVFSFVVFCCYFRLIAEEFGVEVIFKIALVSFCFLLINTVLGVLGFGYPMYGDEVNGIGTRGLIYAGNELGVATFLSGGLVLMYFLCLKKMGAFFLFSFLLLVNSFLIATKTSIIGSFLIVFAFVFFVFFKRFVFGFLNKKIAFFLFLFLMLLLFLFIYFPVFLQTPLGGRLVTFYGRSDFIDFIFSGRFERVSDGVRVFRSEYSFLEMLLGSPIKAVYTESDFFDFLFVYGFLGFFLVLSIFFVAFFFLIYNFSLNNFTFFIAFLLLVLFFVANAAGHALTSGTSSFLIGILLSLTGLKSVRL